IPAADFWPDVIHTNDWHSALVPAFLRSAMADDPRFQRVGTVLTIHNLLHQGLFPRKLFDWLGLPQELWTPEGAEFYGQLNFMKAGIVCADLVNTVSPTYAKEIQTPEYGEGLDGLLRSRSAKLSGILNGIDVDVWNPAKDAFVAQKYSKSSVEKKRADKAALQKEAGLRSGTIPIVRSTGGLADTVADVTESPSKGNGFAFREYTQTALLGAVQRAVRFYQSGKGWKSVVQRGMSADLSWKASARQYVGL